MLKEYHSVQDLIHKEASKDIIENLVLYFLKQDSKEAISFRDMMIKLSITEKELEDSILSLLFMFLKGGKSSAYAGSYEDSELKIGRKIELEHVDKEVSPRAAELIAEKIAKDHLAEFKGRLYYSFLVEMEKMIEDML